MKATHLLTTKDGTEYEVYWDIDNCLFTAINDDDLVFGSQIQSLVPLPQSSTVEEQQKEEEILTWKEAAFHWGQGVELDYTCPSNSTTWEKLDREKTICFFEYFKYRKRPKEPVVEKRYRPVDRKQHYWDTLREAKAHSRDAIAFVEITYKDSVPVSARILKKDEN